MKHGSTESQALFPLVIMAVKKCPSAAQAFQRQRSEVPLVNFLPWINQLVSHMNDETSASVFGDLLTDIAAHFPNHVRLPFAISRPQLPERSIDQQQNDLIWKTFYACLDYLRPPEKAMEEFYNLGFIF